MVNATSAKVMATLPVTVRQPLDLMGRHLARANATAAMAKDITRMYVRPPTFISKEQAKGGKQKVAEAGIPSAKGRIKAAKVAEAGIPRANGRTKEQEKDGTAAKVEKAKGRDCTRST